MYHFIVRATQQRTRVLIAVMAGAIVAVSTHQAFAQLSAHLLKDVNPAPVVASSWPLGFASADSRTYFRASTPETGFELWVTDGTEAGTRLVDDLEPGPASSAIDTIAAVGDQAYFTKPLQTATGEMTALWTSDGTASGTREVARIRGLQISADLVADSHQHVYFAVRDNLSNPNLWMSDGTAAGTQLVKAFPDYASLVIAPLNDGVLVAGNVSVDEYDLLSVNAARELTSLGRFAKGGCSSGPDLVPIEGTIYFFAGDNGGNALWRTDGSAQATLRLRGGLAGCAYGMTGKSGQLYFASSDPDYEQYTIWQSDGSQRGTRLVAQIPAPAQRLTAAGPRLYLSLFADDGHTQLWTSDGTSTGTRLLTDESTWTRPLAFAPIGDRVVFEAPLSDGGSGLWTSDGTAEGTRLLRPMNPSGEASIGFSASGNPLLFSADDGVSGQELWITDGTTDGTERVRNIARDDVQTWSSEAGNLLTIGNVVYFVASVIGNAPDALELWRTDGSADGTVPLTHVNVAIPRVKPGNLTALGNRLYFTVGSAVWTSDGTPAGTVPLMEQGSTYATVSGLTPLGNLVFFSRSDAGNRLCRSDGTVAGTRCFAMVYGPVGPLTALGNEVFFAGGDPARELWAVADSQPARLVKAIRNDPIFGSYPSTLTAVDGKLLFFADDGIHGFELWSSDGTAEGTVLVADINPGARASAGVDTPMIELHGRVYFAAADEPYGMELWRTDGTTAGTERVDDLFPGPSGSSPKIARAGEHLFYAGRDGEGPAMTLLAYDESTGHGIRLRSGAHRAYSFNNPLDRAIDANGALAFTWCDELGCEPWLSDGSVGGTRRLDDVASGPASSMPVVSENPLYAPLGSQLLVAADDGIRGRELWVIPLVDDACLGDCSGDRRVTINELVIGVAIALERRAVDTCVSFDADGDGHVLVNELLRAINRALSGCAPGNGF